MPLTVGQQSLKAVLIATWSNTLNQPPLAAQQIANALMALATTGLPQTIVTGLVAPGQAVAGAVTASPGAMSGQGTGGIDKSSPGMGLAAAKPILMLNLTSAFSNPKALTIDTADKVAAAITDFLSQAIVMTMVTGVGMPGSPTPPPAGPVGPGAWTGAGVGGLESTSGVGLASVLPLLISQLTQEFANTMNQPPLLASHLADAIFGFYTKALVTTTDVGNFSGGAAVVAPPPAPPVGATAGPSPASGTGTGGIV